MVRINQLIEYEARISKGVIRQDPVVVRKVFGFILRATGRRKELSRGDPSGCSVGIGLKGGK